MDCNAATPDKVERSTESHQSRGSQAANEVHEARSNGCHGGNKNGEADLPKTGQLNFHGLDDSISGMLKNGHSDLKAFSVNDGAQDNCNSSSGQAQQGDKTSGGKSDSGACTTAAGASDSCGKPADTGAGTPAAGRDGAIAPPNDGGCGQKPGNDGSAQPTAGTDGTTQPTAGTDGNTQPIAGTDGTTQPTAGTDGNTQPTAGTDNANKPASGGTDLGLPPTDGTLPRDLPSKFPGDLQPSSADAVTITGDMHSVNDVPQALRPYVTFEGDRMVINGHGNQLPPIDLEGAHNVTITDARIANANGAAIIGHNSDNIIVQNSELGQSKNEGVRFENSSGIALRGNYIHDNGDHGVEIYQSQSVDTSENYLKDNGGAGIQYDGVSGPGNRINNNISIQTDLNKPFEDHISWLSSSGTPTDRGQINGNFIEGRSNSNSGSGITIEPGNGGRAGGGYLDASNNTLINPGRNGMAATGGDHYTFTNNSIDQSTAPANLESWGLITYNFVPSNPPGSDITISNNKVTGAKNWMDPSIPPAIGWDTNT